MHTCRGHHHHPRGSVGTYLPPRQVSCSCPGNQSVIPVEDHIRPQKQHPNIDALISWIGNPLGESPRRVDIQYQDDVQGWGLCAVDDIEQGSLLVNVPMEYTIYGSDSIEADVPWNVQMVERLLENGRRIGWKDWVGSMPTHVDIPWIYWEDEEITALEDEDIIREIYQLRGFLHDEALREYLGEYAWEDILWAFSMIHSRSFLYGNQHIFVPIVDMANHTSTYNASVGVNCSPSTCQGREAQEEIAPVSETVEPSTFQLVASHDISRDEQITISYGSLCNDVLLLYFGFALDENDYDQVVVFQDTHQACEAICTMLGLPVIPMDSLPNETRLFVMKHGADPRLLKLIDTIIDIARVRETHSVGGILRKICQQHLESFSTSLEEDRQALSDETSSSSRELSAISFRYNKKAILHAVVACI
jgi:hypothetical protein